VENFNETPVDVVLDGKPISVGARDWVCQWR